MELPQMLFMAEAENAFDFREQKLEQIRRELPRNYTQEDLERLLEKYGIELD